jgi:hypothetical protein
MNWVIAQYLRDVKGREINVEFLMGVLHGLTYNNSGQKLIQKKTWWKIR